MLRTAKNSALLVLAVSFGTICAVVGSSGVSIADELAAERDPLLLKSVHRDFAVPPEDWKNRSGAVRLNADHEADPTRPWFIEYQMQGGRYVLAGLATGNADAIDWGLKVIEWGFARMQHDGSFDHPDSYHSASFFIESTAHALLLLEASALRALFDTRMSAIKAQLLNAARWMIRPDIYERNWPAPGAPVDNTHERKYTHRYYLVASALGLAGVLCDDAELKEKSRYYIDAGIARQRPDGVNPERDGHDTSYQAVGLMFACRYYRLVADEPTQQLLRPMLEKSAAWLLGRVEPDGSINLEGNVRTGPGQEPGRSGKPKTHDYPATVRAFLEWSALIGDSGVRRAAESVAVHVGPAPR